MTPGRNRAHTGRLRSPDGSEWCDQNPEGSGQLGSDHLDASEAEYTGSAAAGMQDVSQLLPQPSGLSFSLSCVCSRPFPSFLSSPFDLAMAYCSSGSDRRSDTLLEFYGFVERWARVL